jgi:hypothetical protein
MCNYIQNKGMKVQLGLLLVLLLEQGLSELLLVF